MADVYRENYEKVKSTYVSCFLWELVKFLWILLYFGMTTFAFAERIPIEDDSAIYPVVVLSGLALAVIFCSVFNGIRLVVVLLLNNYEKQRKLFCNSSFNLISALLSIYTYFFVTAHCPVTSSRMLFVMLCVGVILHIIVFICVGICKAKTKKLNKQIDLTMRQRG